MHDTRVAALAPVPALPPKRLEIAGGQHDLIGEARSTLDFEAAERAGFAPAQSVYRRGTRVIDLGVENARIERQKHDALPDVAEACARFEALIASEKRHDHVFDVASLRLSNDGCLATPRGGQPGVGPRTALTEHAFASLVAVHHSGIGGAGYLARCWPELRAINVNRWLARFGASEIAIRNALPPEKVATWEPRRVKMRFRNAAPSKGPVPAPPIECFGVVTPSYTAFDVDKIAQAVALAMPKQAKCDVTYDGRRATVDIRFPSTVKPEHYVAGEFFRAGIRVRTDDTGGGSILVSSTIWQNLCLNLIIIDRQDNGLARIRHVGSVDALAKKLSDALAAGKESLAHFLTAWGYASEEKIAWSKLDADADVEKPSSMKIEDLLPGIFNGLMERELVPVRGRRADVIQGMVTAWGEDRSAAAGPTRAAIVNAVTRYAHEGQDDPWYEDELERAAGRLLYGPRGGAKPAALPYVPVDA